MGREEGSGWGTHVYLWQIHFDIWQIYTLFKGDNIGLNCVPQKVMLTFLIVQWVKNLPTIQDIQEMLVLFLGLKDTLEEEMTKHSSILA